MELFDRPKMGFSIPLGRWLNGPLRNWVLDCADPVRLKREGFLDPAVVSELTSHDRREDEWYAYKLWAICVFQGWLEESGPAAPPRRSDSPAAAVTAFAP
jgi:asparagine synthase (glutamine-hydrolysing)